MKIMVAGSRHWTDGLFIRDVLALFWKDSPVVMHGGCVGADLIAADVSDGLGFHVEAFPPDPTTPSPKRYHDRNDAMLAEADLVIAFRALGEKNAGTNSVIRKARKKGLRLMIFDCEQAHR